MYGYGPFTSSPGALLFLSIWPALAKSQRRKFRKRELLGTSYSGWWWVEKLTIERRSIWITDRFTGVHKDEQLGPVIANVMFIGLRYVLDKW